MRGSGYWDDPYLVESIADIEQSKLDALIKPIDSDKIYIVQTVPLDGTAYYELTGILLSFNINYEMCYDGYYMQNKNIVCGIVVGELRNFFVYRDIFIDITASGSRKFPNYGIVGQLTGTLNNCHSTIVFDNIEYSGINTISGLAGFTQFVPNKYAIIIGCTSNISITAIENSEYKGSLSVYGAIGNNAGLYSYIGNVRVINTLVKANVTIEALPSDQRGIGVNVLQGIGYASEALGCCVYSNYVGDEYYGIGSNIGHIKACYTISSVKSVRSEYYQNGVPIQKCRIYGLGNAVFAGSEDVPGGIQDCYVKLEYESIYDVFINIETYVRQSVSDDYYYIIADINGNPVADCRNAPYILGLKASGNGEKLVYMAVLLVGGVAYANILITSYDYVAHPFGNTGNDGLNHCYYSIDDNNRHYYGITEEKEVTNEELLNTSLLATDAVSLVVNSTDENGYGYGYINKAVRDEFDYLNRFGKLAIRTGYDYDDCAYISCYQQDLFLNYGYPSLTRVKYRYVFGTTDIETKEYPLQLNLGGEFIVGMHMGSETGEILGTEVNYGLKIVDGQGNIRTLW